MGRPLPTNIHDFKEIIFGNYRYVDKSLFIKEFIDTGAKVTFIPRPQRSGKTTNLSMLKYFFEKTEEAHIDLFSNLAISKYPEYMKHQGQYPVVFLTFKCNDCTIWNDCFEKIKQVIGKEFERHTYLLESPILLSYQKQEYEQIMNGTASQLVYELSLEKLITYLAQYYQREPIVLIDNIINTLIRESSSNMKKDVEQLLQGKTILKEVDECIVLPQVKKDSNMLWNFLLFCGYRCMRIFLFLIKKLNYFIRMQ